VLAAGSAEDFVFELGDAGDGLMSSCVLQFALDRVDLSVQRDDLVFGRHHCLTSPMSSASAANFASADAKPAASCGASVLSVIFFAMREAYHTRLLGRGSGSGSVKEDAREPYFTFLITRTMPTANVHDKDEEIRGCENEDSEEATYEGESEGDQHKVSSFPDAHRRPRVNVEVRRIK
jgi:hypothetical protein